MDFLEKIAEKVIPVAVWVIIGALFSMYYDVARLKEKAVDYKERADVLHNKMLNDLQECTKQDIIQNKDLEYLKGK